MRTLAVAVVAISAVASAAGGTAASSSGTIAFVRGSDRFHARVVLMNADGSGRRVIRGTYAFGYPVWAPDGSRLAFSASADTNQDRTGIDVVGRDGTGLRRLTPHAWFEDCSWPTWTPDSHTVGFTRNDSCVGDLSIYTVHPDGTGLHPLTSHSRARSGIALDPAWSPDGRTVVYTESRACCGVNLALMRADGRAKRHLAAADVARPGGTPTRPTAQWSRDGSRIYYRDGTVGGNRGGLSVVESDGTNVRRLVSGSTLRVLDFALSPDGTMIAFTGGDGKNQNVYVMRADGSGLSELTNETRAGEPAWSPDGRRLAFTSFDAASETTHIATIDADGSNRVDLVDATTGGSAPAWAPER